MASTVSFNEELKDTLATWISQITSLVSFNEELKGKYSVTKLT